MRRAVSLIFLVGFLISCTYHDVYDNSNVFHAGTYKGQLLLIYPLIDLAPMNVTLTFASGRFTFQIDSWVAPCTGGTYKISGQELELTTDCVETPVYLSGDFQLLVAGRQLKMSKASNTPAVNVLYDLTLQ